MIVEDFIGDYMKAKISIAVIAILVIVALLCINKPTESVEVTSVAQVVEPTPAPTATLEPTIAPTIEPTATPVVESIEVVEESKGVSEAVVIDVSEKEPAEESIVDVEKPAEEVEEVEATPTPEIKEEEKVAESTPAPEATPTPNTNPNVTTTTTTDKQAEAQAEILKILESRGGSQSLEHAEYGNTHGFHGNGTKYGDLQ